MASAVQPRANPTGPRRDAKAMLRPSGDHRDEMFEPEYVVERFDLGISKQFPHSAA